MTPEQEMQRLRHEFEDPILAEAALAYIRADYLKTHAWTKSRLCIVLGHPDKYPEGQKPPFSEGGCPCGKRREPPRERETS